MALEFPSEDAALDGEVHFLKLEDLYVKRALCYPNYECPDYSRRLRSLVEDGFIYLLETGGSVLGSRFLGKGYSAVVVVARNAKYGIGALKILRSDSRRRDLLGEAEIMIRAQLSSLVPRLYALRDFYIFRELVSSITCKPLTRALEELVAKGDFESLRRVLKYTLTELFKLDAIRVDHTELNRPEGHVFYCEEGRVVIIDWESARVASKPSNLTSFTSYLVFRSRLSRALAEVFKWNISEVLSALRAYKTTYSTTEFTNILRALRLVSS